MDTILIIAVFQALFLGFYGYRQGNFFTSNQINIDLGQTVRILDKKLLETATEVFINKLLDHIKTLKPYIDPDLTLARLSSAIQVSPEYLFGILSGYLKMNFFQRVIFMKISV
jgi:hypothetical protein